MTWRQSREKDGTRRHESAINHNAQATPSCTTMIYRPLGRTDWILMFEAVTAAIPGSRTPAQVDENVSAADLAALPAPLMQALAGLYRRRIAPQVHALW